MPAVESFIKFRRDVSCCIFKLNTSGGLSITFCRAWHLCSVRAGSTIRPAALKNGCLQMVSEPTASGERIAFVPERDVTAFVRELGATAVEPVQMAGCSQRAAERATVLYGVQPVQTTNVKVFPRARAPCAQAVRPSQGFLLYGAQQAPGVSRWLTTDFESPACADYCCCPMKSFRCYYRYLPCCCCCCIPLTCSYWKAPFC